MRNRRPLGPSALIAVALLAAIPLAARAPQQNPDIHPDIHFVPTPTALVDAMLSEARVTASDVIYDLGSGDGRIVITAAQKYGARGVGIEIDPQLVKTAIDRARKAGVSDKVTFLQADLFKTDLSPASVVTLYLSYSINLRLRSKLMTELKPGSRIVSHRFPIGDWRPDKELTVNNQRLLFWTIPGTR